MIISLIPQLTIDLVIQPITPFGLTNGGDLKEALIKLIDVLCAKLKVRIQGLDWTNDAEHFIEAEVELNIDGTIFNESFEKRAKAFGIPGTLTDISKLCELFIQKVNNYTWPE